MDDDVAADGVARDEHLITLANAIVGERSIWMENVNGLAILSSNVLLRVVEGASKLGGLLFACHQCERRPSFHDANRGAIRVAAA